MTYVIGTVEAVLSLMIIVGAWKRYTYAVGLGLHTIQERNKKVPERREKGKREREERRGKTAGNVLWRHFRGNQFVLLCARGGYLYPSVEA